MNSRSKVLVTQSKYLGQTTNNQAEYQALIHGLEAVRKLKIASIDLKAHLDSELVVKQMNGEYRVKDKNLKPLFEKVQQLVQTIGGVRFIHVVREKNRRADSLVNRELDKRT